MYKKLVETPATYNLEPPLPRFGGGFSEIIFLSHSYTLKRKHPPNSKSTTSGLGYVLSMLVSQDFDSYCIRRSL